MQKFVHAILLSLLFVMVGVSAWCGNVDPDVDGHRYAWADGAGWLDFKQPESAGVTISDSLLTGYVWSENAGWIRLDPDSGGVTNDGSGNLSGWAWGDAIGWISFSSDNHSSGGSVEYGVKVNPYTGKFSGYAWSETMGWITFDHAQAAAYGVTTSWRNDCPDGDTDNDGVSDCIENQAPGNGDGNSDTIPDRDQPQVTSLVDANGQNYITIEVSGGCGRISHAEALQDNGLDDDFEHPCGLVAFELPCESAAVTIYYHGVAAMNNPVYRKYGPVPSYIGDDGDPRWYGLPGAVFDTVVMNGKTTVYTKFDLADGAIGDDTDGDDNTIYDQGGPAVSRAEDIPTVNQWGLLFLLMILSVAALLCLKGDRS